MSNSLSLHKKLQLAFFGIEAWVKAARHNLILNSDIVNKVFWIIWASGGRVGSKASLRVNTHGDFTIIHYNLEVITNIEIVWLV